MRRPRKTDIGLEGDADVIMLGQTVPSIGAEAKKKARSPTMNSRVRRTFSDSLQEADRRSLRASKSAVYSSSSARYNGAVPWRHLYTRTASLNWILSGVFSQCIDKENINRAAEFMTGCRRRRNARQGLLCRRA